MKKITLNTIALLLVTIGSSLHAAPTLSEVRSGSTVQELPEVGKVQKKSTTPVTKKGVDQYGFDSKAQKEELKNSAPVSSGLSVFLQEIDTAILSLERQMGEVGFLEQEQEVQSLWSKKKRPNLKVGQKGASVTLLKETIEKQYPQLGSLRDSQGQLSAVFDEALKNNVMQLQEQWGIEPDGIVGPLFYWNLLRTSEQKLQDLKEAQQEYTQVMQKYGDQKRLILVNVNAFNLKAIGGRPLEDEEPIEGQAGVLYQDDVVRLESRVVVGQPSRATPLQTISVWGVKVNPDWRPPPGIMSKDVFPAFERSDSATIRRKGLRLYDTEGKRVDPAELMGLSRDEIEQRVSSFVQPAGDDNALGLLKFETNSAQNIYLHDTNDRSIFAKSNRALSSGCVRVQSWAPLAIWIAHWEPQMLADLVNEGKTRTLKVFDPVPVVFLNAKSARVQGSWSFFPPVYSKKS